ncbi:hypothetical protein F5877DRAFT_85628 [Lentinula edodes]|nr:hypothetical protein F5877DRAFT_85628 [Lentinula edodes]
MPSSSNNAALGAPSLVRTLPPSQLLPLHVTPENPDIDKLTTTVEDPSLGQLWLFKSVFGMYFPVHIAFVERRKVVAWLSLTSLGVPLSFSFSHRLDAFTCTIHHPITVKPPSITDPSITDPPDPSSPSTGFRHLPCS